MTRLDPATVALLACCPLLGAAVALIFDPPGSPPSASVAAPASTDAPVPPLPAVEYPAVVSSPPRPSATPRPDPPESARTSEPQVPEPPAPAPEPSVTATPTPTPSTTPTEPPPPEPGCDDTRTHLPPRCDQDTTTPEPSPQIGDPPWT